MSAYTAKQMERGRRELRRAEAWRKLNAEAYAFGERVALELAAEGLPVSGRAIVEAMRRKSFVDNAGDDCRINNNIAPIVARWIATEHPEAAGNVERRRTVYDELIP